MVIAAFLIGALVLASTTWPSMLPFAGAACPNRAGPAVQRYTSTNSAFFIVSSATEPGNRYSGRRRSSRGDQLPAFSGRDQRESYGLPLAVCQRHATGPGSERRQHIRILGPQVPGVFRRFPGQHLVPAGRDCIETE